MIKKLTVNFKNMLIGAELVIDVARHTVVRGAHPLYPLTQESEIEFGHRHIISLKFYHWAIFDNFLIKTCKYNKSFKNPGICHA